MGARVQERSFPPNLGVGEKNQHDTTSAGDATSAANFPCLE